MDHNMDSPGSCSLDVNGDAEKTSDTEDSSTPIAQNNCSLKVNSIQKSTAVIDSRNTICELEAISQPSRIGSELSELDLIISSGKKPSYLNLACCVNGYSSITTYNSKIRKDINKSRDVSPIRPSINSFQYCKKSNNLTPPLQLVVSNLNPSTSPLSHTSSIETKNNYIRNGNDDLYNSSKDKVRNSEDKKRSTSFIQQRVERLYGPGALAQGFYSPKKIKANLEDHFVDIPSAEFNNKLKMLSLSGDYRAFNKKNIAGTESAEKPKHLSSEKCENNINDLPVLRLLSQEFRAQLPSIASKRSYVRKTEKQCSDNIFSKEKLSASQHTLVKDEVDYEASKIKSEETEISKGVISMEPLLSMSNFIEKDRDGSYYLSILRNEQSRLLALADRAEKYIELLSNNIEVSEDIFGVLRSACGQARLLATQKMKQFEGLCYKNLSSSLDDQFPTTVEDLQGFWDMVYLQVSSINETFEEIELLKKNDWKKTNLDISPAKGTKQILFKQKKIKPITFANIDGDVSKTASRTTATQRREAQRKQLVELKRKHKMALAVNSDILPADGSNPITNESDLFVKENSS